MTMLDELIYFVGRIVVYIGGSSLGLIAVSVLLYLMAKLWVEVAKRWRGIVEAEALIYEYRLYRDEFKQWIERDKKKD